MAARAKPANRSEKATPSEDPAYMREVGQRIKQARLQTGAMKQRELGELLEVTERSIQGYEEGERIPHGKMPLLEKYLGKPVGWFYHGDQVFDVRDEQHAEIIQRLAKLERTIAKLVAALEKQ